MSENNFISRRQFLEVAGGGLALYAASPLWLRLGAVGAEPAPAAGRKLLVLLMEGGNDGLNTVVPYGHSAYFEKKITDALAAIGPGAKDVAAKLVAILGQGSNEVQLSAAWALGEIGAPAADVSPPARARTGCG